MDIGHYWELRPSWPGCKALSFPTIWFLSHMNTLPSLWVTPSAPKWRGTSAVNTCSTSPTASSLQAGTPWEQEWGMTPWVCREQWKPLYGETAPPSRSLSRFIFKIIWMWIFHFITLCPKALNAISLLPSSQFSCFTIWLSQWGLSFSIADTPASPCMSALPKHPGCAYFEHRLACQAEL